MLSNGKEKFEQWARSSRWAPRLVAAAEVLDVVRFSWGVAAQLGLAPDVPDLLELTCDGRGLAARILAQIGDRSGTDRGEDQQQTAAPQIAAQLPASAEQDTGACSNSPPHDEATT
jgi:hypothetical protein